MPLKSIYVRWDLGRYPRVYDLIGPYDWLILPSFISEITVLYNSQIDD